MEACRSHTIRAEAESRERVKADVARERASLREARSALEVERRELLQRAARAEAVGQAKEDEVSVFVFFFLFSRPRCLRVSVVGPPVFAGFLPRCKNRAVLAIGIARFECNVSR